MKVRLVDIAHARSGDKGDTANVGVIALQPRWYSVLEKFVTREQVAAVLEFVAESLRTEVPAGARPL